MPGGQDGDPRSFLVARGAVCLAEGEDLEDGTASVEEVVAYRCRLCREMRLFESKADALVHHHAVHRAPGAAVYELEERSGLWFNRTRTAAVGRMEDARPYLRRLGVDLEGRSWPAARLLVGDAQPDEVVRGVGLWRVGEGVVVLAAPCKEK